MTARPTPEEAAREFLASWDNREAIEHEWGTSAVTLLASLIRSREDAVKEDDAKTAEDVGDDLPTCYTSQEQIVHRDAGYTIAAAIREGGGRP